MRSLGFALLLACGSAHKPPPDNTAPSAEPSPAGTIRVLVQNDDGGVITLVGDRGAAMDAANRAMAKHCGDNRFTIFAEGEEAVGAANPNNPQQIAVGTEWRVHYNCVR